MRLSITIFLLGLIFLNFFIYWLSIKVVPFYTSLPTCQNEHQTINTLNWLFPGKHIFGLFIEDESMAFNQQNFTIKYNCKVYNNDKLIYNYLYDISEMQQAGWGVKFIPETTLGFFRYPINDENSDFFFKPKLLSTYRIEIEVQEASKILCDYKPKIGLFCLDIDKGYFGIEYITYNFGYLFIWGFFSICIYLFKRFI